MLTNCIHGYVFMAPPLNDSNREIHNWARTLTYRKAVKIQIAEAILFLIKTKNTGGGV